MGSAFVFLFQHSHGRMPVDIFVLLHHSRVFSPRMLFGCYSLNSSLFELPFSSFVFGLAHNMPLFFFF